MSWFPLICLLGFAISTPLVLRQGTSILRRFGKIALQGAIWLLVWSLFTPPALLPVESEAQLKATSAADVNRQFSAAQIQSADTLQIPGDGLLRDGLRDLPPVRLQPGETSPQPGWQVQWTREINLGEPLRLQVALDDGQQLPAKLVLEDPFGSDAGSALLSTENRELILQAWPKLAGNWLYRVRIETEGSPARIETLPVTVRDPQSPHVLVWLARPGFESAALARWLRQSGTPTQVVTQLAPEIQRSETFNNQSPIKNNLLDSAHPIDLVILDSRLWSQFTAAQRKQLEKLATNKSLLWLVDDDSSPAFVSYATSRGMPLEKSVASAVAYAEPAADTEIPALQLTGLRPVQVHDGDAAISAGEQVIYWARVQPQSSIGFVFFRNSYRWQTAGNAREFAQLWKQLFDHQLALRGEHTGVAVSTELPRAGERIGLCSEGFAENPPQLRRAAETGSGIQQPVALGGAPAANNEHGRCYSFWPQQSGWYQLAESDFGFYVHGIDAWPEWRAAIERREIRLMASARLGPQVADDGARAPLPRYWIALALLAALVLSWWRERSSLR
ncbi:hypothetical protein [Microbulbifer pacificus]|uniref:DUF4350 domain-containing protein n=1 Tax=Microbulbifer pacificus TaxID=407164 RepID=A0AAU0MU14_9GAMM|nr:hypothetical protein [Microbulbifer pacificus]WOX03908.1 hypothetical protein R5R33_09150 [Microbulbifer pacificus]